MTQKEFSASVISVLIGLGTDITPIKVKFIIVALLSPFIAVYVMRKDKGKSQPKIGDTLAAIVLSIVFVWFGYELACYYEFPLILALIASFFLGTFSLTIIMELKKQIPQLLSILVDKFKNIVK